MIRSLVSSGSFIFYFLDGVDGTVLYRVRTGTVMYRCTGYCTRVQNRVPGYPGI